MNDPDQTVLWPVIGNEDDLWTLEDPTATEEHRSVDPMAGFVSLGYITSALRRRIWVWAATALIGLLIGSALFVKFPPSYQAETSILVNDGTNVNPAQAITTDAALATSRTVASRVVRQLGLTQTVSSFQASYIVTPVTNQLLQITVSAPTSAGAVARAAAIASSFLQFHTQYAQQQQQQLEAQLGKELSAAQKTLNTLNARIAALQGQPPGPTTQTDLSRLTVKRNNAEAALNTVTGYVNQTLATSRTNTSMIVSGSQVIDPAAVVKHSKFKAVALYVAGGLFCGLAVGIIIVVIGALLSDRLRRRDDIAGALGAPVRLSVRSEPGARRGGGDDQNNADLRRVVSCLRAALTGLAPPDPAAAAESAARTPALAVVAVENEKSAAPAVAGLAFSCASQGKRVILADLADGAPAAGLLGVREPGVVPVTKNGVNLTVLVPAPDEGLPTGPLRDGTLCADPARVGERLAEACTDAHCLITLASLDPALGADHLVTWAADAVVLVTAGRSSATRVHGVGEMLRIAGVRLLSAIVLKSDKHDESIGVARPTAQSALAAQD